MLRIHYLQQWFGLSDPATEEALHDAPLYREFAQLDGVMAKLPDETTILRFRHLLARHDLATDMLRVVNDILQAKGLLMRRYDGGRGVDRRAEYDQEPRPCAEHVPGQLSWSSLFGHANELVWVESQ